MPARRPPFTALSLVLVSLLICPQIAGTPPPATATAAPLAATIAYPLKLSANHRYLVDQNNQPVFWSGDTPWSLIAEATTAEVDLYLNNRQAKGFNVLMINLIEHKFATNAPANIYGEPPFTGAPFTTPNEAYFARADYVIAGAAQRGMAVLLVPLYLGYACGDEGWCAEVQAASVANLQAWGQYVGNRYKGYANIVWVIGADVDPAQAGLDKVTAFVTGLQAAGAAQLITAHNQPGSMAVTPWAGAGWLTVNNTYVPEQNTYQLGYTAYTHDPVMPYFHLEGYYENEHGMTSRLLRAQSYWSVLSGAFGYLFGNCPIWNFESALYFCSGDYADWQTELNGPGSAQNIHIQAVFGARAWYNLVPDWNHAALTAGYGTWGQTNYVTAARTADGSLVMAYLPSRRTVTVDLSKLSGPATARWFDPTSGLYTVITGSPFANSGSQTFAPPGNNAAGDGDWVLILETAAPPPTATPASQQYLPFIGRLTKAQSALGEVARPVALPGKAFPAS